MKQTEARQYFISLRDAYPNSVISVADRTDVAILHIGSKDEGSRWAELSTPGGDWFSLVLSGGFMRDVVDEEAKDEEVKSILAELFELGLSYVDGDYSERVSRWLRIPTVEIAHEGKLIPVDLSIDRLVRRIVRGGD